MTSSLKFRGTSTSSSSANQWTYDVFLSFGGQDTRKNFTGHLYDALERDGLKTYIDDEQLRRGEEIPSELLKAIEESRISVVVLSENYASSAWCLEKLTKIFECVEKKKHMVLPVFDGVDPSYVRNQRNNIKKSFGKLEERFRDNPEKVERWNAVLRQVSNISRWHLHGDSSHESLVVGEIVREIARHIDFQVDKHPDEIKPPVKEPHLYGLPLGDWNDNVNEISKRFMPKLQRNAIAEMMGSHRIESPVQEPHLSSSPNPIGIESLIQLPQSSSPNIDGIESPVQVSNLSSLPSGNSEQGNNPSISSEQGSNSFILSHEVIPFLIGSVISLLQLNNLFKTHPTNMWISEVALVMFCLSYAAMRKINGTRWAKYSQIIDIFRMLSGTLVVASLSSINLPHQLWWLFFAIWTLMAFIVVAYNVYRGVKGRAVETRIFLADPV